MLKEYVCSDVEFDFLSVLISDRKLGVTLMKASQFLSLLSVQPIQRMKFGRSLVKTEESLGSKCRASSRSDIYSLEASSDKSPAPIQYRSYSEFPSRVTGTSSHRARPVESCPFRI